MNGQTPLSLRNAFRAWFSQNVGKALAALLIVGFVGICLIGMMVETLNKPSHVSEQAIEANTKTIEEFKDKADASSKKIDDLTAQIESLEALTRKPGGSKPSDYAGTWVSNNFKLVIRKDGTGTFEVAQYYHHCIESTTSCKKVVSNFERSGTVKFLPTKGEPLIRLTATKTARTIPGTHKFETYRISKTSDNRMVVLVGSQMGRVVFSGCNTSVKTPIIGCQLN